MTTRPIIPGDYSRCSGTHDPRCTDCARRLQIPLDRENPRPGWGHSYMQAPIRHGVCSFWIKAPPQ